MTSRKHSSEFASADEIESELSVYKEEPGMAVPAGFLEIFPCLHGKGLDGPEGPSREQRRVLGAVELDGVEGAAALHLEHLTLLWVRMVRAGGRSPHLVWAALSR